GWRPKRSILFASWDAEEFTLTSSTEWGEQHADRLRRHAIAYLNVDSAASGRNVALAAVPPLNRVIAEAALTVRDPLARIPLIAVARERRARERGALPAASGDAFVSNRLGSGSDYTVFLNHLGIPIADLSFDGPYGVYHSIYDNHNWVSRIGDPGFRYHVALVQLWGVIALRIAQADVLPLDYSAYAPEIRKYIADIEGRWPGASLPEIRDGVAALESAAAGFERQRDAALAADAPETRRELNRRLIAAERALLDEAGIPGRSWYRHQIYAPKFTYAPEVLPAVAEALEAEDRQAAAVGAARIGAAIRRAAAALH
ncbi:MAG TPA: transferrin receptor-like dimerization domain-containing protein, partial [Vicinamibacterales bacterium]|nr:transferrin receptor-like dimerization domain-containing protein [Vicinamibacterales bacterium]